MKKITKNILEIIGFAAVLLLVLKFIAFAQSLPLNPTVYIEGDIPVPPSGQSGQETIKELVFTGLSYAKILLVVAGILMITIEGFRLIWSGSDEEEVTKARRALVYILIGFVIVSMSQDLAKIFDMDDGTLLSSPQEILSRIHIFDKEVEIFITFVKYIIGAYATLMIVISGLRLLAGGGDEEEATSQKKSLMYSIAGLLLIFLGDIAINKVFYKVNKEVYTGITGVEPYIDTVEGVKQTVGITNFVVSFIGPISVLMLIVGAIMYVTSTGKEEEMEKAKRLIWMTFLGMVIIFGAFALVSTVISGQLSTAGALLTEQMG
ncbi:hypothetical protein GF354_06550 [Candidatus Peregrinibacteria bacterium]|nr:hypothetical protein [Candidatus Peregrinibacteria bacterium]